MNAIHNPHGKPLDELPTIYGFNNGLDDGPFNNLMGVILAEDGTCLGSHICSSESWMYQDLGILEGSAPSRHERFREHYPDGYRMEFVKLGDVRSHAGLAVAFERNQAIRAAVEEAA